MLKPWVLGFAAAVAGGTAAMSHAGSYSSDFSAGVGAASLRGSAVVDSGSVRLTPNAPGNEGSLVVNLLDPGAVVQSFDATFTVAVGPTGGAPADGYSLSFGPPPAGTYGENGTGSGLAIVFDLYNNGESPTPPVIRALVNGTQVAASTTPLVSAGAFRSVTIHVDSNGIDLNYDSGAVVWTDLSLPGYNPSPGDQFTFGARTGSETAEQRIDDVSITTTAVTLPPSASVAVPGLSGAGLIAVALLLAGMGGVALRRRALSGAGPSRGA